MRRDAICFSSLLTAAILAAAQNLQAANINWSTGDITGDADVFNSGQFILAAALGAQQNQVINGVSFSAVGFPGSFITGGFGGVQFSTAVSGHNLSEVGSTGSGSAPFANLSPAYQTLLSSGVTTVAAEPVIPMEVDLDELTPGVEYLLQFWVNDSSAGGIGQTEAISGGGPTLLFNVGASVGSLGQYAIGTFIADGTDQTFDVTPSSGSAQINAIEVEIVPEPSTLALASVAGLAAAWRRRCAK